MIAAIMQPYFFPYIGYFQLMSVADVFVFHDDVQYIKSGWINRNRIFLNGEWTWFTLPVSKGSASLQIRQRTFVDSQIEVESLKRRLHAAYSSAPFFHDIFPFISNLLNFPNLNVAAFNINLLKAIALRLKINCKFLTASEIEHDTDLKGQARVLDICSRLCADRYVNPIGGLELYDGRAFEQRQVALRFLRTQTMNYSQLSSEHVPFLSIIDVMMFNSDSQTRSLLKLADILIPSECKS